MSTNFKREHVKSQYVRKKRPLLEMNRYKYLLSMEVMMQPGWNGCLYYNSVDVMSQPTAATWAMKDLLVPFIHYIPLSNDYSNLLQMIKWANVHDDACQEISQRATKLFIEHLWMSKQAKRGTPNTFKWHSRHHMWISSMTLCPGAQKQNKNSRSMRDSAEDSSENPSSNARRYHAQWVQARLSRIVVSMGPWAYAF